MWTNRNVWIVLAGEFIAGLGLWMSIIANLEFMQQKVPSDFMKSLILFAGLLAGVLFGPLAGRVIDTTSKKKVLMLSGAGRLVSVCFMFVALYFDSIWWMVLFAVTLQISAAFYFPALQSVIPLIVKERELLALNGVHMNAGTIARILGTTLAGLMLTVMSLQGLYVASFVAYVALLASTAFLNVPESGQRQAKEASAVPGGEPAEAENRGSDPAGQAPPVEQSGFKALLPVLRSEPTVLTVLWLTLVPTLFIGGFNLMVINISELQHDAQVKGLLYAVEGVSFILAGFLVKWMADRGGLMNRLFLFAAVVAAAQCLLYFADSKLCALLSFGLFGLAAGGFFPAASTLFQKQIPKAYHGRFFSFRSMLDRVVFQVVLLSTGLLLDSIGLQLMVLLYGVLSFLLVAVFAVREARSAKKDRAEASL
ncbi:MFS transporter [Paenibacillus ehimensis]|uniref:MFS transporter n=1 Tax=Paenibacillus ehimensis TaxID=79264 RepID=A0ABT8V9E5_9BACL|nr:MFS transporter [Paenibacillus ehimensis]MDO3677524.1 MFS transporter [Paenibacillus ehimensis]MEC0211696.1 MFS transporter [Paenibacillus ehimensis]